MIRAIFFDLDNTLVDRDAAYERFLDELGRRCSRLLASPGWRQQLRELDDHGLRPRQAFCAAVAARFPELGLSAAELWQDFAEAMVRLTEPRPLVTELLERVGQRFRLAVISNGDGLRQRAKLERCGLAPLIGDVFVSGELGLRKPDPRIFQQALRATGLAAPEVLFVGDDPERDIAGADAAGLATCWISHRRPYPAGLPGPGRMVPGIEELLRALADGPAHG